MYELVKLTEKTFYMDCPAKVGFYLFEDNKVVTIDSGSDKDAAKKVKKIIEENGWELKAIFNTHSHADHTGGNQYLQSQFGCKVYAPGMDYAVTKYPPLEPIALYGGYAMRELKNKFLMAKESDCEVLTEAALPSGLSVINLPGHSYDMVGFKTDDGVIFLADSVSSRETIEKYQLSFLYDVEAYLDTLEKIKELSAKYFVPSHAEVTCDISELAQINIEKTKEIIKSIMEMLATPMSFEELLANIFERYNLTMNLQQRMLLGSTLKSYLSYLKDRDEIEYYFVDNMMFWRAKKT